MALRGLATFRDRRTQNARLGMIYDPNAPASLVAAALPEVASSGLLPPYDLASFLENKAPEVRAAALLSMNVKKALPPDLMQSVLARLEDSAPEVRRAAIMAVVAFRMSDAVPNCSPLPRSASRRITKRRSRPCADCPIRGPARSTSRRSKIATRNSGGWESRP